MSYNVADSNAKINAPRGGVAVDFPITLRCSCRCRWCSYNSIAGPEGNASDISEQVVDDAINQIACARLKGVDINQVRIIGGQPTEHLNYRGLLRYIVDRCRDSLPGVNLVILVSDVANEEDIEYARRLGIEPWIGKMSDKRLNHKPFPLDWGNYGVKLRRGACTPSRWPACGAISFRKIDDGPLIWAICPVLMTCLLVFGDIDEMRPRMDTIEHALDPENRKFLMERYCKYCWYMYDYFPEDVFNRVEEKGLFTPVSLAKANKEGQI